jgi:hypothetical protein
MTKLEGSLCDRLKRVGFTQANHMRLYGQEFILRSDPIISDGNLVFVDAIEKKSGQLTRLRIPLTIVKMAMEEYRAA